MDTKTEAENRSGATNSIVSADTALGFAVIGCFVAGGVGISKAVDMTSGLDVLLCLLGSVAAFGMVFYIYFRRD
jgi:UDP-N-acetylmuramyl pentapeptide phosphotransferase/UDP-N-acetylglucosamine-1-phosphate transferase